ncbi:MAG TPA: ECF transporter S component [Pseudogracilibacillus sp.]|nr:ECF transporter S component [Pseudogracilibacillus sp.]
MNKIICNYFILLLFIPLTILIGVTFFDDRSYIFISFILVILAAIPFFISFENKEANTRYMVIIAVLVALSVVGRFLFTAIPAFKPVTAIVVISAMFFGAEAGFLVGALSAIISNMYFGQGPWTPFQMFSWGIIGFIAGLPKVRRLLKNNRIILILYGIFAGVIYSLMMDIWSVLSIENTFNFERYLTVVTISTPFMITYAVSNVIFLLLIIKPIGEKLDRIKIKYGI